MASKCPPDFPRGVKLLHDPARNKGTAFTRPERSALGLRGLLPPVPVSQETQVKRVMEHLRAKPDDLERYVALIATQDRNEILFYRVLTEHLEELLPIIYTPTVGRACEAFGHIFRRPRGLYVSAEDRGEVRTLVENWPHDDVRMIVVTDGERILGLGDLGTDGMGIPIGKLSLYSACAGIHPTMTMPVMLDVGTNNASHREDPFYMGIRRPRLSGADYDGLVGEFIAAVHERFPRAVIQLEDFATHNAFRLLAAYRDRVCLFNDDIQGTAAVALAGLISASRLTGVPLGERPLLFLGAGEAGVGIGELVVAALVNRGWKEAQARRRCWYFDSAGLVVAGRGELAEHKRAFAHEGEPCGDFLSAIETLRPGAIIGVSGQPGLFDEEALRAMARCNERPVVFALSNPTSRSECTAEQAYRATSGQAVFASGSPFAPVELDGRVFLPGQGNNAYIFPGVGLGLIVAGARQCTDRMFLAAARALVEQVGEDDLALGRIYPPLSNIRQVSAVIAERVAAEAFGAGLATAPEPRDLAQAVRDFMFEPVYPEYA